MTYARLLVTHRPTASFTMVRHATFASALIVALTLAAGCQPSTPPTTAVPAATPGKSKSSPSAAIGKSKVATIKDEAPADNPAEKTSPVAEEPKKSRIKFPGPSKTPKPALRVLEASPQPLFLPTVEMSDGHRRTCVVGLGDTLPQLTAANLAGEPQNVSELFGEKLTIIVFWNHRRVFAHDQFARLKEDVAAVYDNTGVAVIAINVGDQPDAVAATYQQSGGKFPCLVDPQSEAFAQLAREKLPRTFVVDPAGKILWFDIECSLSTARELDNAVRYFLQPSADQKTL